MCVCMVTPTRFSADVVPALEQKSLHEECVIDALVYKWIRSEEAGYDLGVQALRDWVKQKWSGFLRSRWVDHLCGTAYWTELKESDHGLLVRRFKDSPHLARIVQELREGGENLTIINRAIDEGLSDTVTEEFRHILESIDVNGARLKCELLKRLCPGDPDCDR